MSVVCGASVFAETGVRAYVTPSKFSLGENAQLVIEVDGSPRARPEIARVDGLEVTPVGMRKETTMVNFQVQSRAIYTYLLTPEKAGRYAIPPIRVALRDEELVSTPVMLDVTPLNRPDALGPPAAAASNDPSAILNQPWSQIGLPASGQTRAPLANQANLPQSSSTGGAAATGAATPGASESNVHFSPQEQQQPAVMRMTMSKKNLYVGEVMPVEFKLYVRENTAFRVLTFPTLDGDALVQNQIESSPRESSEIVDGRRYHVLSWMAAISAVKEGSFNLGASMKAVVMVAPARRLSSGSIFDLVFSDPMLAGPRVQEMQLAVEPKPLRVEPLPVEGRPASFDGAIGQFQIQAQAAETTLAMGDPLTLKISISGKGNFDRITRPPAPSAADASGWKTYNPSAQFEPGDSVGYAGRKTFTQAWLAKGGSIREAPALQWSYFDPSSAKYTTLTTPAIPLQVTASGAATAAGETKSPPSAGNAPVTQEGGRFTNLAPAAPTFKPTGFGWIARNSRLQSIGFGWAVFLGVAAGVFSLIGLGVSGWRWLQREDPAVAAKKATERAIQQALQDAESALQEGSTARFFSACRRALQHRLGCIWSMPPSAITLSDLTEKMPQQAERLGRIFEIADQATYSGEPFTAREMQRWKEFVVHELVQLDAQENAVENQPS